MFSLLMLNRRWCDSGGRQPVWDVCFLVSSLEVSGYRGVGSWIKGGWYRRPQGQLYTLRWKHKIFDQAMSTRSCVVSLLKVVDSSLGDENPEFNLLDSPLAANVRRFLLEGVA